MIKRLALGTTVLFAVLTIPAASLYATTSENGNNTKNNEYKVTLCHATRSVAHPYVKITVSVDAAGTFKDNGNGDHAHHSGSIATSEAVAEELKKSNEHWGDIIPVGAHNTSLNWTAMGQAIYEKDCHFAQVSSVKPASVTTSTQSASKKSDASTAVTELPQTGGENALALTLIASGVTYVAAGLALSVKKMLRRTA